MRWLALPILLIAGAGQAHACPPQHRAGGASAARRALAGPALRTALPNLPERDVYLDDCHRRVADSPGKLSELRAGTPGDGR